MSFSRTFKIVSISGVKENKVRTLKLDSVIWSEITILDWEYEALHSPVVGDCITIKVIRPGRSN